MKVEDYYGLEAAIPRRLVGVNDVPVLAIATAAFNKDFDTARGLVLDVALNADPIKDFIRTVFKLSFNYGSNLVDVQHNSLVDDTMLNLIVDNFCQHLNVHTLASIHAEYYEVLNRLETEQTIEKASVSKDLAAEKNKGKFIEDFVSFADPIQGKVQMVSGLHSSRLATWGFVTESKYFGLTEYELTAMLDSRTSSYCQSVHGTRFKVRDAEETILQVLSANPDDLRTLQPFPPQNKEGLEMLAAMSPAELTANNWHIPPFHPWCRTMCVVVGYTRPNVVTTVTPLDTTSMVEGLLQDQEVVQANTDMLLNEELPTPEVLKEVKLDMTVEQVEAYNSIFQTKPASTLGALSGVGNDFLTLQSLQSFTTKTTTVEDALQIKTRKLFPSYTQAGKNVRPYHDVTVKVSLTEIVVEKIVLSNIKSATNFFKSYVSNVIALAAANSIPRVAYNVSGDYAHTLVKLGFAFTADVDVLRAFILAKLATLESLAGTKLSSQDFDMLRRAANSSALGKEGIRFITEYPAKVGGVGIGQFLLSGFKGQAGLDLSDARNVSAVMEALQK